jgi:hypothetical protein
MSRLTWDQDGERRYETGTKKGVVYPQAAGGTYTGGEAWNGLIGVTESPSGAEPTALYANDGKYGELMSNEEFGGTIEAYTYPDAFAACDGSLELVKGVRVRQQARKTFGLSYVVTIGNDTEGTDHGYVLHLVYGAKASPSEQSNTTINDSPEAKTMSWEFSTTPVAVTGFKPTSHVEINSLDVDPEKLSALEDILYGTEDAEPRLPLPDELKTLLAA